MLIVSVQISMTLATICFALGLAVRHRNNPLHRKLMLAGFIFTLGIALVLVVGVHGFGLGYGPADWLVWSVGSLDAAWGVLIAHRIVATVTFIMLLAQVITGLRRHSSHRYLHKAVVPLWLVSYLSGLVIFD